VPEKKMNSEQLTGQILFKLYRKGVWGGRHTPLKNLLHLSGQSVMNESKKIIKELNKEGLVNLKKSTGEYHISLNSHKKKEIRDFILGVLNIDSKMLE
jgi:predicted transcriptional regulator YheO